MWLCNQSSTNKISNSHVTGLAVRVPTLVQTRLHLGAVVAAAVVVVVVGAFVVVVVVVAPATVVGAAVVAAVAEHQPSFKTHLVQLKNKNISVINKIS
jgi:hypothetical protein